MSNARWPRLTSSLRARVALVVLLAFLPAFLVVYVVANNDKSDARDETADETRALAASVAAQYEGLVDDTQTLLRAIGTIPGSDAVIAQCPDALAALVRQAPTYDDLFVAEGNGALVCSARPVGGTVLAEDAEWLDTTVTRGMFVGLVDETFTIAISFDAGGGTFVATAQIALDGLAALVEAGAASDDATVALVDEKNAILYERSDPAASIGDAFGAAELVDAVRNGDEVAIAVGPDGVRRIYTGEELRDPDGAMVLAGIPTAVAYEAPARSFRVRIVVLVIATLAALAIALAFAHLSVIRRIRGLVAMTRRIGAGDLTARSEVSSGDEIGELGRSLDAMAEELSARDVERAHLLGAVVEASEEERRRIAGDVHDDSIQVMSAHVMSLQLLRRRVDDADLEQRILELEASGRAATARLRDLVFELHSPTLEEHGLNAALESLVDRTFEGVAVTHTVTSTLSEEPPRSSAATAYRIAQEAIHNARQHARPSTVRVDVGREGDDLVVQIVDDGAGFDPHSVEERPGHLGLRGIRERAAAVGGRIEIDTAPGRGTMLLCRIPWLVDV